MLRLRSGRAVGVSFDPYLRLLTSNLKGRGFGSHIHFRLHVHCAVDLTQFASVLEFHPGNTSRSLESASSEVLLGDLALGKVNWSADEIADFDRWISHTKKFKRFRDDAFDSAKWLTREHHVFLSSSAEGYKEAADHSEMVDKLFSRYPIIGLFHFTDTRNIPIIRAARGICSSAVISRKCIPVVAFGGDP